MDWNAPPVAAGDIKGSNRSLHQGSAANNIANDPETETAPNHHLSLRENIPVLIRTPRRNNKDNQYPMEQHIHIQQRLVSGRVIEPTARNNKTGCASHSSTKVNGDATRAPAATGDAAITFHSANKDREGASNQSDENNDDIHENDNPNSNINVLATDAAALAATRNMKDEGRATEEDRRQLPTKTASVSSALPHDPKLMLNAVRHLASFDAVHHDCASFRDNIPGAPLSNGTAEIETAKKDDKAKETKIDAEPANEAAIAPTAPTDSGYASVSQSSETVRIFLSPLPPIQRYSSGNGMLPRPKRKTKFDANTPDHSRGDKKICMVRVDVVLVSFRG